MYLKVSHTTAYQYDHPVDYALQQLRIMPKDSTGQRVLDWKTEVEGGHAQVTYIDQHRNHVELVSFDSDVQNVIVHCEGEVDVTLTDGVVGKHIGLAPLWLFERQTELTTAGPNILKLARQFKSDNGEDIARFHALSAAITHLVEYKIGQTGAMTSAEEALSGGAGVCQDHAHIFISVARILSYPARYVSGYLLMDDRIEQEAGHAWAEVYLPNLGWVGFDVSNGICPDERYIRVATGLDYFEAAPVAGMRYGKSKENMIVSLQVQQ